METIENNYYLLLDKKHKTPNKQKINITEIQSNGLE